MMGLIFWWCFFEMSSEAVIARAIPQQRFGIFSICQILLFSKGQKANAEEMTAIPASPVAQEVLFLPAVLIAAEIVFLFSL